MVVVDKRRYLIVSTAGHFFNTSVQPDDDDVEDREILDRFLEQSSCRTLCARPIDADQKQARLKLSIDLSAGKNTLVFFKVCNGIFFFCAKIYATLIMLAQMNEITETCIT